MSQSDAPDPSDDIELRMSELHKTHKNTRQDVASVRRVASLQGGSELIRLVNLMAKAAGRAGEQLGSMDAKASKDRTIIRLTCGASNDLDAVPVTWAPGGTSFTMNLNAIYNYLKIDIPPGTRSIVPINYNPTHGPHGAVELHVGKAWLEAKEIKARQTKPRQQKHYRRNQTSLPDREPGQQPPQTPHT